MAGRARMWMWVGWLGAAGLLALSCKRGPPDLSCRNNRDCLDSEICHPETRLCVELCVSPIDCPGKEEERVCQALSDTDSTRICKCLVAVCLPPGS